MPKQTLVVVVTPSDIVHVCDVCVTATHVSTCDSGLYFDDLKEAEEWLSEALMTVRRLHKAQACLFDRYLEKGQLTLGLSSSEKPPGKLK